MRLDLEALIRAGESALRVITDALDDLNHDPRDDDARVTMSILFADIEGFSDLVARRGDDVAEALVDTLDLAVADATDASDAWVVKRLGDGVMIACADPADAVEVLAALPDAFAAHGARLPERPRLRAGAHRGEVRRRGDDLFGYHVNVAARVAEHAAGGQALLTRSLLEQAALEPPLVAVPAGVLVAKGVPERPELFAVHRVVQTRAS